MVGTADLQSNKEKGDLEISHIPVCSQWILSHLLQHPHPGTREKNLSKYRHLIWQMITTVTVDKKPSIMEMTNHHHRPQSRKSPADAGLAAGDGSPLVEDPPHLPQVLSSSRSSRSSRSSSSNLRPICICSHGDNSDISAELSQDH